MSCKNENRLLRRPLPPNKNKKNPVKLPAITRKDNRDAVLLTCTNNSNNNNNDIKYDNQKKSKNHRGERFDIFEDGDKNLSKPLGPEPFFPIYAIK